MPRSPPCWAASKGAGWYKMTPETTMIAAMRQVGQPLRRPRPAKGPVCGLTPSLPALREAEGGGR